MGVGRAVLDVAIVASKHINVIVLESLFSSPKRPTMSGQTWRVT